MAQPQRDRQNSSIMLRSEREKAQAREVRPLETMNLRQRRLKHRLRLLGEGASKGSAPPTTERINPDRPLGNDEAKKQPSVSKDNWQLMAGDKVSRESDPSPRSLDSLVHQYEKGTRFKQRLGLHSDGASNGSAPPTTKGMTIGDHQLVSAPPMTKEVRLNNPLGYDEAKAQPSVVEDDHLRPSARLGMHSCGASKGSASPTTEEFRSDPIGYARRHRRKHRLRLLGEGTSKVSEPPMTEQVNLDRPLGNDEAKAQPSVVIDHWQLLAGDKTSRESDPSPGSLDSLLHQYDKSTRFKQRLGLHSDGASKGSAPPTSKGMTISDHQSASAPPMTKEVRLNCPIGFDEANAQSFVADEHRRPSAGEKPPQKDYASPRQSTTQVGCEFDDYSNKEDTAMAGGAECPCAANDYWQLSAGGGGASQGEESHPSPPISIDPLLHQYVHGTQVGGGEKDDGNNMENTAVEEDRFRKLIQRIRAKVDISYDDSIDDTVYPVHGYIPSGKEKKTARTRRISQQSYDTGLICIEIAPFFKNLFGKDEQTEDASSEKKAVDVDNCSAWEANSLFAEDLLILDQQFEGTFSPEESILIESIEAEAKFGNFQASSGKHNSSSRNSTSCDVVLSSPVSVNAPLETRRCA